MLGNPRWTYIPHPYGVLLEPVLIGSASPHTQATKQPYAEADILHPIGKTPFGVTPT